MLIDWFTVGAQAINFLILVWLMKRFLYQPILNAIDTREKLVAKEIGDADAKKAEAQKEHDEFQSKSDAFDAQREAMLKKATEDVGAEHQRLMDAAQKDAQELRGRSQAGLAKDAQNLTESIRSQTQKEIFAIARKTLTDLASASLEAKMAEVFCLRLDQLDAAAKAEFVKAIGSSPATLRSTFELPAEQRSAIHIALNVAFSTEVLLKFETSPELVSGIELTAAGQKLAWSISDYLGSMEKSVAELVGSGPPLAKPEPSLTSR